MATVICFTLQAGVSNKLRFPPIFQGIPTYISEDGCKLFASIHDAISVGLHHT